MLDGDDTLAGGATLGAPKAPPRAAIAPGALFGRFLIVAEVGAGAFGQVFSAFDPQLDRKIALKVLRGHGEAQASSLVEEARAQAQFTHPNVVTVYDAGTESGRAFIAMELVDGVDFASWIERETKDDWRATLALLLQAGEGLVAAHAETTIHRDFKPGNILVGSDGRARVGDFGLAVSRRDPMGHADALPTTAEPMVGTPYYMAPELFDGETAGVASDQYAFAVTAFEALYGVALFERESFGRLIATKATPTTLPANERGIPKRLGQALLRALDPDPQQRWPTMQSLLDALRVAAAPTRRPWRAVAAGIVVFVALTGGIVLLASGVQRARLEHECETLATELSAAWTPDARSEVDEGLMSTGARYAGATRDAVLPMLDAYADALGSEARAACRAARLERTMPSALWPRARRCFEDGARSLRSTAKLLSRADEAILRSAQLTASMLPPAASCGDVGHLSRRVQYDLGSDPAGLQTMFDAQVALRGGSVEDVRERLEALRDRGASSPLVLAALADVELASRQLDDARVYAKRAYLGARATDDTPLAAAAATTLAAIEAADEGRLELALLWAELALGELDTLDEPELSLRRADVHQSRSRAATRAGDFALAAEAAQQELEIHAALLGPQDPRLPLTSIRLASAQLRAGETTAAHARLDAASDKLRVVLGAGHPDVAKALDAQARLYARGGDSERAYELDREALQIRETAYGQEHAMTAQSNYYVGVDLMKLERNEEAITHVRRGLEIQERVEPDRRTRILTYRGGLALALGAAGHYEQALAELERVLAARLDMHPPTHPKIGVVHSQLAFYAAESGAHERALEHGRTSLRILEDAHGSEHPYLAFALEPLARGHRALRQWTEARAYAERALAVRQDTTVSKSLRADSGFILAKILWDAPGATPEDRSRALRLAQDAARDLDEGKTREDAKRWVRARGHGTN